MQCKACTAHQLHVWLSQCNLIDLIICCSVLERYPGNGKVLKVYGRFLEFVRNDPWTAAKYYEEALKQGTSESMLAMTAGQAGSEVLAAAVGSINEKTDGLVIINAQGIILMVNAAIQGMFGYEKGELEGKNVSVLM
jgi:PAS domain-containing protein